MSFGACADIVRKGDRDRFLATMAAPTSLRGALFAIYAFNVEVSRAAWASAEPMVCEMRVQFWRDVLALLEAGEAAAGHEVISPLAGVVDLDTVGVLHQVLAARRWDVQGAGFADGAELETYLKDTAGGLMWAAARVIGVHDGEAAIRKVGYAAGLASWFRAVPELVGRGRAPLPDDDNDAVAELAKDALRRLKLARKSIPRGARYATRAGWLADRTLGTVAANPAAVAGGWLHISEFSRRTSLLWRVMLNRP